jgi:predicted TIM-barrel fold metal-dependent hydrolase
MSYNLISADSHINEHPDLWQMYLPERLKERGPRTVDSSNGGQGWVLEGQPEDPLESGLALGLTAVVYRSTKRYDRAEFRRRFQEYRDGYRQGIRYEDILPGSYEPSARVKEQDEDGVDAEVLYNNPLIWAAIKSLKDPELKLACFRAYNDWIADFNAVAPDRLFGTGLVPPTGIDDAVAETRRCIETLNLKSVTMESWPNGSMSSPSSEDDRFWQYADEAGIPVNVHIGFAVDQGAGKALAQAGAGAPSPAVKRRVRGTDESSSEQGTFHEVMARLIMDGIFERFPRLRFVGAEVNCGWVPDYFRRFDYRFRHDSASKALNLSMLPSEYFRRNVSVTFLPDYFGVRARWDIGVANMMWSSDFPHSVSNWPIDGDIAYDQIAQNKVPDDEAQPLLWKNCADMYGIHYETAAGG